MASAYFLSRNCYDAADALLLPRDRIFNSMTSRLVRHSYSALLVVRSLLGINLIYIQNELRRNILDVLFQIWGMTGRDFF
jgi:hypothetical protein